MSTQLSVNYSGILINQNVASSGSYAWRIAGGDWVYQTFRLPADLPRGTNDMEYRIPDLSGVQVMVSIDASYAPAASCSFVLQYLHDATWVTLSSGTTIGSHIDGTQVWLDCIFPQSVPITSDLLIADFRFGLNLPSGSDSGGPVNQPVSGGGGRFTVGNDVFHVQPLPGMPTPVPIDSKPGLLSVSGGTVTYSLQQGVSDLWYVSPTPLSKYNGTVYQAFRADGTTPLLGADTTSALNFRLLGLTADSGHNFLGNEFRASVAQTTAANVSTTQNDNPIIGSGSAPYWMSPPLPSRFSVCPIYFDMRSDGDGVVVDSLFVNPLTPNMAFNVYYSVDDSTTSSAMTETDWERKLWTRVPQIFVCDQSQQYVFPAPIFAKYVKVEFTNLQSRTYDPGPFPLPVKYKKFPTWVANFFIAMMEFPSFVAAQVNVEYDALSFAYDYFLDDLGQAPTSPSVPPQSLVSQLTTYFQNTHTNLDPSTLAQIALNMKPFQQPLGANVDTTTVLGNYVSSLSNDSTLPTVVEGGNLAPVDRTTVSSLQREPVIFEQSLPVMYFFVTCRHGYMEMVGKFDQNRAYFAGVNQIAFFRDDYTVPFDTPLYIESGWDRANTEIFDFFLDSNNVWLTYSPVEYFGEDGSFAGDQLFASDLP